MVEVGTKIAVGVAAGTAQDVVRWAVAQSKHYAVQSGNVLLRSYLRRRAEQDVVRDAKRWTPRDCAYVALAPQSLRMRVDSRGGAELHVWISVVPRAPFGIFADTASLEFKLGDGCGFAAKIEKTHSFNAAALMLVPTSAQLCAIFPPGSFDVATQPDAEPIALTLEIRGNLYFQGPWPDEPKPSIPIHLEAWCSLSNCAPPPRAQF